MNYDEELERRLLLETSLAVLTLAVHAIGRLEGKVSEASRAEDADMLRTRAGELMLTQKEYAARFFEGGYNLEHDA